MLPCKKRRTTLTESPQHQGNQEEDDLDLESAVKPESDQVKDLGSVSVSWGPSYGRAAGLEVQTVQDAGNQLGMEDPSLSSGMLTQDTNTPVVEAVDVAISQGITLPSLESSQSLNIHIGKGKLQATSSRRGKKIILRPGSVAQEDRGDHLIAKEPFSGDPSEEFKEEGGKIWKVLGYIFLVSTSLPLPLLLSSHSLQCLYKIAFLKEDADLLWNWSCGACKGQC